MTTGHHHLYILIAVLIAMLGSWTALDLNRRVRAHRGGVRIMWLTGASVAMGLSIWSMHFVATLGLDIDLPVRYDAPLTIASLLLAIGTTSFAFVVMQAPEVRWRRIAGAGLAMGSGICVMHFVGMAAMRLPATISFDYRLVALSFLIAISASWAALLATRDEHTFSVRVISAIGLGFAISIMHFTAMAAARFEPISDLQLAQDGIDRLPLAFGVSSSTLLLLFLALVSAMFDRRFEVMAVREAKALADREAQLRGILGHMPVGILVARADSRQTSFANAEARRLIGPGTMPTAELFGEDGQPLGADDQPLARTFRTGEPVERMPVLLRRRDGQELRLEVSTVPIRDQQGRLNEAMMTIQDVTARFEAEQVLRQSQRLDAVGQLTGGVAHDFNNLLTAIIGGLELAQRRIEDEKVRRWVGNALQAAQRGAKLTAQLLAFSRRQRLEAKPTDVDTLIAGMRDLLARTLGGTVEVVMQPGAGGRAAVADPTQLELAVLNLAINARDAMPSGGRITISTAVVEADEPRTPFAPPAGTYLAITVGDTGTGMPPDVLAKAFDPFFTTKPVGKGSGLGLSQVLGLAKQLGGGLAVDTVVGSGTRITIYLPPAQAVPELPVRPAVSPSPSHGAGARVLVVDDDDAVRSHVCDLLREDGFIVEQRDNGAAALAAIETLPPFDAVLLDFAMPGMTGAETERMIRARWPSLPVLMMTGYADLRELPPTLNGCPIVQKPFDPQTLVDKLLGVLAGREPRARQAAGGPAG